MRISANHVTAIRLVLLPFPMALMYVGGHAAMLTALGIFILLGLTDALDGYLARKYGPTPIGALLDQYFGIVFSFRWTGAALACAVMGFPLLVRSIRLSLDAVDRKLEDAAGTLGANPAWVFLTVTLPLILPGIIAGMILSFAKAMGEFGATITFVSNIPGETQTLPTAIYTLTQVPGGDAGAMRLTLIAVAISMVALLVSEALARRTVARHREA